MLKIVLIVCVLSKTIITYSYTFIKEDNAHCLCFVINNVKIDINIMSILTLFMTFIEKNIILLATQKEAAGLVSRLIFE